MLALLHARGEGPDGATGGLTKVFRQAIGVDCEFKQDDLFYNMGYGFGFVGSFFIGTGEVSAASHLGSWGLQAVRRIPAALGQVSDRIGEVASGLRPALSRLADDTGSIGRRFTSDQQALVALAKDVERGARSEDALQLWEWAQELGLPGHGPAVHDGPKFGGTVTHINIGPVKHIPVLP